MFNIIGGFGWGIGVTLLGYFLGTKIPNVDAYIEPVIGGAMLFAFAPTIFHISKDLLKRRRARRRAKAVEQEALVEE